MAISYNKAADKFGLNFHEKDEYYNRSYWTSKGTYITPKGEIFNENEWYDLGGVGHDHVYSFDSSAYDKLLTGYIGKVTNESKENLKYLLKWARENFCDLIDNFIYWQEAELCHSPDIEDYKGAFQMFQMDSAILNIFKTFYNCQNLSLSKCDGNYFVDLSQMIGANIIGKIRKNPAYPSKFYSVEEYFYDFNSRLIKEILVRHLGYDSLESNRHKTITTSCWNIYERFYNYILMDYSIQQVSRFIYDKEKNIYVEGKVSEVYFIQEKDEKGKVVGQRPILMDLRDFLISDNELRLKEEIQAIKRLVPLDQRPKYFR